MFYRLIEKHPSKTNNTVLKEANDLVNISHNRLAKATEALIQTTFLTMLATNAPAPHLINVKQLCQQAHINRSTFYAHYQDIYDLAEQIQIRQQRQVVQLLDTSFTSTLNNFEFVMTTLFEFVYKNRYFYQMYLQRHTGIPLFDAPVLRQFARQRLVAMPKNKQQRNYRVAFVTAGVGEIMRQWLADDCQVSPAEMAQLVDQEFR